MVSIEEIQAAYYMVAATGVLVAAAYYVQNLRTNEKIRRRDMVFQRLNVNTTQHYNILYEVLNYTWDTWEEYDKKYGFRNNREAFSKLVYIINHYNCLGILMRDGVVDADEVFQLNPPNSAHAIYTMWEPWILRQRMNLRGEPTVPDNYKGFEYLYHEIKRRFPNLAPLRQWPRDGEDQRTRFGMTWDEFFRKNPQLLENPYPGMIEG